ncbi:MAG: YHS domain-containing protein [Chloroflexi bacterium]|nr:YHS domain-containing protein [Chloroflexota bacterium]
MELTILESSATGLRAGYDCPCGCTPSVGYERGGDVVAEGCCCGNHFVVGPQASSTLAPVDGFRLEAIGFTAPWGEGMEAAWLVGPSVHGPASEHDHDGGGHDSHGAGRVSAIDPVCGMTVEPEAARVKGLHSSHQGRDFFFCGKGCKLEFDDDPGHYLDPAHVPSM